MEAGLAKVELAMANTREVVDLIKQGMEKGLEDLRPSWGGARLISSTGVTWGVHVLLRQGHEHVR